METHKINGIELLMPQVPKDAINIKMVGILSTVLRWEIPNIEGIYTLENKNFFYGCTVLGTCWREGDKLVCEGFCPAKIMIKKAPVPIAEQVVPPQEEEFLVKHLQNIGLIQMDLWLRSKGITIPEGQKRVLIKIN